MLDTDLKLDIRKLESLGLSSKEERITWIFSATFSNQLQQLTKYILHRLFQLLEQNLKSERCLIFVETQRSADSIGALLSQKSFMSIIIHENPTHQQRNKTVEQFTNGKCLIFVATFVAARGLDFPFIDFVVNYDLPDTSDFYIRLIGRTSDALHEAFNMEWRANNNDQTFNEKLVILITDGAPNGLFTTLNGADPWILSKKFKENNITLVVVGVSESINECDDFYCALAQNTGGQYIPLVNAERIIQNIIYWMMNEETTYNQCFRHIMMKEIEKNSSFRYLYVADRVNGMINECHTINDIRKIFFNHRVSTG
ncbi:unnamed protein product [Rotaria sp. Silwood1]|nr:unnamed protein product [Rotaria sp. Silwood1]